MGERKRRRKRQKERQAKPPPGPPACDYCGAPAVLEDKAALYPHRPDLAGLYLWRCSPCEAWVGCHPGTIQPLGRLANAELRLAKQAAHAAFDPLWKAKMRRDQCSKTKARGAGYKWLAGELGIDPSLCHIGMMDPATCHRVVEICAAVRR